MRRVLFEELGYH